MRIGRWTIDPRGFLRDAVNVVGLIVAGFAVEWFAFGIGLFVVGACLHFWSKGVLVRNWTVTMGGPYRVVRHPFYLANFIIDTGICLLSGSLILTLLYLPAYLLTYIPTIRREEKFLVDSYGGGYIWTTRKRSRRSALPVSPFSRPARCRHGTTLSGKTNPASAPRSRHTVLLSDGLRPQNVSRRKHLEDPACLRGRHGHRPECSRHPRSPLPRPPLLEGLISLPSDFSWRLPAVSPGFR